MAQLQLLSYQAWAVWNDGTEECSHCATLYVQHGDRWYVAFHQQTPAVGS